MSTPNINLLLTSTLYSYDNLAPNTPVLVPLNPGSLPFGATAQFYNEYFKTAGAVSLPLATCYVLWVRNRDAANPIIITPTYTIGGAVGSQIGIGDVFLFYGASKNNGFTALTLAGVGGSATCELYVAG